ncbi:hypothetical protein [Halalkalibacter akibai]|uniref:RNA polymerase subunit sigma-70 n=1 Tax=Halalkalibacter akibai (strain ATCC 43226 / DSM 21942 / CIP 109018 / JCM 9157 / 1139) TaxID=1236973 RepID=W4QUT5_HALA3|nr:hypothetical protein [Halalkalibacter akibai]GAE35084.1 hypothetical protein JCM9157_2177 [Halalkalibacter akibai JCM 9157]
MRSSSRQQMHHNSLNPLFNMDYHNFVEKESQNTNLELASEFGISLRDVKLLKDKMNRN